MLQRFLTAVNTSGNCTYGDVRLVEGSNQYEGRVEVCINDTWGTVCDDYWDDIDATVVCKQLGYGSKCIILHEGIYTHIYVHTIPLSCADGRAHRDAFFGTGSGPIFLGSVRCTSRSSQLLECSSRPILSHSWQCFHYTDAGASCEGMFCSLINTLFFFLKLSLNNFRHFDSCTEDFIRFVNDCCFIWGRSSRNTFIV